MEHLSHPSHLHFDAPAPPATASMVPRPPRQPSVSPPTTCAVTWRSIAKESRRACPQWGGEYFNFMRARSAGAAAVANILSFSVSKTGNWFARTPITPIRIGEITLRVATIPQNAPCARQGDPFFAHDVQYLRLGLRPSCASAIEGNSCAQPWGRLLKSSTARSSENPKVVSGSTQCIWSQDVSRGGRTCRKSGLSRSSRGGRSSETVNSS
jgi:hypothetical protein